jgi:hypothetical protein
MPAFASMKLAKFTRIGKFYVFPGEVRAEL